MVRHLNISNIDHHESNGNHWHRLTEDFEVDVCGGRLSDPVVCGAGVDAGVVAAHVLDHHRAAQGSLLARGQHIVLEIKSDLELNLQKTNI